MTEIKQTLHVENEKNLINQVQDFWAKYKKPTSYLLAALVLLVGGFLGYRNFIQEPNEKKATEAMFRAEEYYRLDSARLACRVTISIRAS